MLGVSKTPVREALKTLAGAGLVTMHPYRGAAVRTIDDEQARHIYDLRLLLEPEAVGRAVTAGYDWSSAHHALDRADASADQAQRSLANRDFHHELYAGCGNPLLVRMLDDLRDQTALVSAAAWRHDPAFPPWSPAGSTRPPNTAHPDRRPGRRLRPGRVPAPRAHHLLRQRNFPATPEAPHHDRSGGDMENTDEPYPGRRQHLRRVLATAVVVPVTPTGRRGPRLGHLRRADRAPDRRGDLGHHPERQHRRVLRPQPAEARQALETAAKVASAGGEHGAEVLAGVGHDIATAIDAARHAQDHGARMIMIHQPVHPYVSAEGWVDYHAAIANAVPDLGIVLYIRDERRTGHDIARLVERCPNVVGVKYGVRDATRFAAVARDAGLDRLTWLAGAAELTAPAFWAVGARGFTSGLANVSPALALGMLHALRDNDFQAAMKAWESARRSRSCGSPTRSADNVSVVKEALAQLGLCRADVRPPSRPLPEDIRAEIAAILASWGMR